jgi:hypothetical protein
VFFALLLLLPTLALAEPLALLSVHDGDDELPPSTLPDSVHRAVLACPGVELGPGGVAVTSATAVVDERGQLRVTVQPGGLLLTAQRTCLRDAIAAAVLPDLAWRQLQFLFAAVGPDAPVSEADERAAQQAIAAAIEGEAEALNACYQEGVDRDATLSGAVVLAFVAHGSVIRSVAVERTTLHDEAVLSCLSGTVAATALDVEVAPTFVRYPFQLDSNASWAVGVRLAAHSVGADAAPLPLVDGAAGLNRCAALLDSVPGGRPQLLPLPIVRQADGSVDGVGKGLRTGAGVPRALSECLGNQLGSAPAVGDGIATFWVGPAGQPAPRLPRLQLEPSKPELLARCRLAPSATPTVRLLAVVRGGKVTEAAVIGSSAPQSTNKCALKALTGQRWAEGAEGIVVWDLGAP